MKRLLLAATVLAVAACGRPGEDEYEESVYDAQNPPVVIDTAMANRSTALHQDSINLRFDSIRVDSMRRDSLRQDSIRRGIRRDTMP